MPRTRTLSKLLIVPAAEVNAAPPTLYSHSTATAQAIEIGTEVPKPLINTSCEATTASRSTLLTGLKLKLPGMSSSLVVISKARVIVPTVTSTLRVLLKLLEEVPRKRTVWPASITPATVL